MPDLMSAALFERGAVALVAHRRGDRPPFAGQWLLPMTVVRDDEAAEDALRRHAREQFAVTLGVEQFVDTVYMEDPEDQRRYVTNIFRAPIEGGPMRFDAEGDYDDARWLAVKDLEALWMPPSLRDPLIRIMTDPDAPATHDWASGEALPLAEQQPRVPEGPVPDNRAGWDAISAAYQDQIFGERFAERLMWSWSVSEDEIHLLDDVRGKRVLVLGCGGGQDVVAIEKMSAIAVGVDTSPKQIEYAKKYAVRHGATNASFVEGTVEDLSRFEDESFDTAVAAHMLNYVERIDDTLRETHRVLKPGAAFALSVRHPFAATLSGQPPFRVERAYWDAQMDWTWKFESGESAPFRQWFWTVSQWFEMLTTAGFVIERMLEPREDVVEDGNGVQQRNRLVPYSLYLKVRKR